MRFAILSLSWMSLSLSVLHAAPVPEEQKPTGPAPRLLPAPQVDDAGQLSFRQVVSQHREEVRTRTVVDPQTGKAVTIAEKVIVPVLIETVQTLNAKEYTAYDVAGNKVEEKAMAEALRRHPLVLVSSDGKKVDPAYLKMFREGTVVLVVTPAALGKMDLRNQADPPPPLPKDR
jgi:hypothetical protein